MNQSSNLVEVQRISKRSIQSAIEFPSFDLISNEVLVPIDDGGRLQFVEMESAS
jgi:hypothetical protein